MTTPKINKNCRYVQNDSHKCKIELKKFHFDILCRFGVIKEGLLGGGIPGEIGLSGDFIFMCFGNKVKSKENQFLSFSRKIRHF